MKEQRPTCFANSEGLHEDGSALSPSDPELFNHSRPAVCASLFRTGRGVKYELQTTCSSRSPASEWLIKSKTPQADHGPSSQHLLRTDCLAGALLNCKGFRGE